MRPRCSPGVMMLDATTLQYTNIARIDPREPLTDLLLARAHALGFDAVALAGGRPDDVGRASAEGIGVLLDLPAGELDPWLEAGVAGFCCEAAHERPPASWLRLIAEARGRYPKTLFLAFTYGAAPEAVDALRQCGFDGAGSSSCWWDFRSPWIDEDAARVEALGAVIALTEPPSGSRPETERARLRAFSLAAHYAPLWMMTLGFEAGLEAEVAAVNALRRKQPELFAGPPARLVSAPGAEVAVLARGSRTAPRLVLALNPNPDEASTLPSEAVLPEIGGAGGTLEPLEGAGPAHGPISAGGTFELGPAEARAFRFVPTKPIRRPAHSKAEPAATQPRIAIEAVQPMVEGGKFAAKSIAGATARIEADFISDGHGKLAGDLLWRAADTEGWERTPMAALGNDRYAAAFPLERVGRYIFTVEAWHDVFASLLEDIAKKRAAGAAVGLEIDEAIPLLAAAAARKPDGPIALLCAALQSAETEERLRLIMKPETAALMRGDAARPFLVRREPALPLDAERPVAGFASWYEIFPRSQSGDPDRHGTFADVMARLPAIRAMGFDVLYFPPIHPIGRIHRKGRNNALTALRGGPGKPLRDRLGRRGS